MANLGSVMIEVTPASFCSNLFSNLPAISASVVHCCPSQPTNCRESSQMGQCSGAAGNCVPQVTQIRSLLSSTTDISKDLSRKTEDSTETLSSREPRRTCGWNNRQSCTICEWAERVPV